MNLTAATLYATLSVAALSALTAVERVCDALLAMEGVTLRPSGCGFAVLDTAGNFRVEACYEAGRLAAFVVARDEWEQFEVIPVRRAPGGVEAALSLALYVMDAAAAGQWASRAASLATLDAFGLCAEPRPELCNASA